jgi:hypothetical protein
MASSVYSGSGAVTSTGSFGINGKRKNPVGNPYLPT